MLVAILADTHMPKGRRVLPDRCLRILASSDLIIHAGDFQALEVLEFLESIGPPLVAVHGNVDTPELRKRLPERREEDLEGFRVGVVHDAGPARGRLARLRAQFPEAAGVIFGHSHLPLHETADGFEIFNPGSPTERRRAPLRTMGLLHLDGGGHRFEHVVLG